MEKKKMNVVVRAAVALIAYCAVAWVLANWCEHVRMYGLLAR